jgi:hypothetical protein
LALIGSISSAEGFLNRSLEKLEELTHPGALKQAIRFALHGQGRGIGDSFVMLFAGIETLLNLFVNGVESDERFISTHGLVNFRGQVGTAQMRNAGGVRYTDGFLVLAALVDTSGYGSGIKEKYQAYLITDVAIRAYPVASIPTRTRIPFCFRSR